MTGSETVKAGYTPTIGIETHVQLKSKTKLFAAVGNDARQAEPNTLISHICVALPGALPVLNEGALKLAARAAYALGTRPQKISHFDRKHYFYPDLPKGYQITQYSNPIITGGKVEIETGGQKKTINITRAHLEEDAGKTIHPEGADYSLVDLNRAGTPLLEIVSEPEIGSPQEAKAYARELYLLMKYADVSDVDLYHGNMRFDVNVSVSKDEKKGTRTETKNLNSFKSVENAVAYEIDRQVAALERGEEIIQETRGWDEAKQKTTAQRGKEEAHDYRYFPDPDIPPVELSEELLGEIKKSLPRLPSEWRNILNKLSITKANLELLIEAEVGREDATFLPFIEQALENKAGAEWLVNMMVNVEIPLLNDIGSNLVPKKEKWAALYAPVFKLVSSDQLSSTNAKTLLELLFKAERLPADIKADASEKGLLQLSNSAELEKIIADVIETNPKVVADIKAGEAKAIGFLVGQVMAATKGRANPGITQEIIKKQLEL
jgi:aspartyl-tRNA(Asn)/glutamyl-tRNA(Gln) amidotransferase subunit B